MPPAAWRGGWHLWQVRAADQDPGEELLQGRGGDQERGQREGDGPQGEAGAHDRAAHRDRRLIPEVTNYKFLHCGSLTFVVQIF